MNASKKYPLPEDERRALVSNMVLTDVVLLVIGVVLAALAYGLTTLNWADAFLKLAWAGSLTTMLTPHWAMVALPAALIVVFEAVDRLMWKRSSDYREDVMEIRQGMNGELPRLGVGQLAALLALVGIAEEFALRFGLLKLAWAAFDLIAPGPLSAAAAILLQAGVFMLMHNQYDRAWSLLAVFGIGAVFGVVFMLTSSLLTVIVAHFLYDFGDILLERRRMETDPDYFAGKVPTRAVLDLMDQAEQR